MNELPTSVTQGLRAFNQGEYFSAHEYFEDAWRETPDSSREFYRSLLQISAGFYRLTEDRSSAAKKFFRRALHWLQFFSNTHMSLEVQKIRNLLVQLIDDIDAGKPSKDILKKHAIQIAWESQEKST